MICPKGYEEQTPKPEHLVEDHMTLVKRLAWHFQGCAGRFIELDDLMQASLDWWTQASVIQHAKA